MHKTSGKFPSRKDKFVPIKQYLLHYGIMATSHKSSVWHGCGLEEHDVSRPTIEVGESRSFHQVRVCNVGIIRGDPLVRVLRRATAPLHSAEGPSLH